MFPIISQANPSFESAAIVDALKQHEFGAMMAIHEHIDTIGGDHEWRVISWECYFVDGVEEGDHLLEDGLVIDHLVNANLLQVIVDHRHPQIVGYRELYAASGLQVNLGSDALRIVLLRFGEDRDQAQVIHRTEWLAISSELKLMRIGLAEMELVPEFVELASFEHLKHILPWLHDEDSICQREWVLHLWSIYGLNFSQELLGRTPEQQTAHSHSKHQSVVR